MARRTAMNKEPKTESSRKGNDKSNDSLTRVSPGVYRNSQGKLVGSRGQSLGNRSNNLGAQIGQALGNMTNPGDRMPAARVGDAVGQVANDAGQLAQNNMANQMGQAIGNMTSQMQPGYLPNTQNKPMPWGPQIDPGYFNPEAQRPIQDLAYRFPPGQGPTSEQLRQAFQPVQLQQPNTVSGLLRRGR